MTLKSIATNTIACYMIFATVLFTANAITTAAQEWKFKKTFPFVERRKLTYFVAAYIPAHGDFHNFSFSYSGKYKGPYAEANLAQAAQKAVADALKEKAPDLKTEDIQVINIQFTGFE